MRVNEQSLRESNAILEAAAKRVEVGEVVTAPPAELARESGIENRLAVARAVRALLARGRLSQEGNRYRLVDARPLEPGERVTVRRPSRRKAARKAEPESEVPTYEQVGRAIVERLIELSAETAELRSALERARKEGDAARHEALEATRAAARDRQRIQDRLQETDTLRRRLEMTEANLRRIIEAAKGRTAQPMEDADARAILDVLSKRDA
jgi:chromosome segregation ATPase